MDLCFSTPVASKALRQLDYYERNLVIGTLHKFAGTEEKIRENVFEWKSCEFGKVWVVPILFTATLFVTIRNHRLEIIDVELKKDLQ